VKKLPSRAPGTMVDGNPESADHASASSVVSAA
jgi:hypothetical protein